MILVIGASGKVGSYVLEYLSALNLPVRAGSRDPVKSAEKSKIQDVEWVRFDFQDTSTFAPALESVDQVFLYLGHANFAEFVDTAKKAGVQKIVFLSSLWASLPKDPSKANFFGTLHEAGENLIMKSGIPYVFLRGGEFCRNEVRIAGMVKNGAVVSHYISAKGYHINERDIAEVAVAAFTRPELSGITPALIGDELLSTEDIVLMIAKKLGKEIKVTQISEEVATENMVKMGFPAPAVKTIMNYKSDLQEGYVFKKSNDIQTILGKPPRKFEEWLDEHLHYFQ
ncbi:hypothetical protein HK096_009104 [Nowakowskiella sp. JEL0078]|nr:hypothetical protein HK096_009104 [Nowakowskiella sp. JEL0078]